MRNSIPGPMPRNDQLAAATEPVQAIEDGQTADFVKSLQGRAHTGRRSDTRAPELARRPGPAGSAPAPIDGNRDLLACLPANVIAENLPAAFSHGDPALTRVASVNRTMRAAFQEPRLCERLQADKLLDRVQAREGGPVPVSAVLCDVIVQSRGMPDKLRQVVLQAVVQRLPSTLPEGGAGSEVFTSLRNTMRELSASACKTDVGARIAELFSDRNFIMHATGPMEDEDFESWRTGFDDLRALASSLPTNARKTLECHLARGLYFTIDDFAREAQWHALFEARDQRCAVDRRVLLHAVASTFFSIRQLPSASRAFFNLAKEAEKMQPADAAVVVRGLLPESELSGDTEYDLAQADALDAVVRGFPQQEKTAVHAWMLRELHNFLPAVRARIFRRAHDQMPGTAGERRDFLTASEMAVRQLPMDHKQDALLQVSPYFDDLSPVMQAAVCTTKLMVLNDSPPVSASDRWHAFSAQATNVLALPEEERIHCVTGLFQAIAILPPAYRFTALRMLMASSGVPVEPVRPEYLRQMQEQVARLDEHAWDLAAGSIYPLTAHLNAPADDQSHSLMAFSRRIHCLEPPAYATAVAWTCSIAPLLPAPTHAALLLALASEAKNYPAPDALGQVIVSILQSAVELRARRQ